MFSGMTSSLTGLLGGGSSSNPAGPSSQSWGGDSGSADSSSGSFMSSIGGYLKQNWPGLVGGMAGSIVGGIVGKRLTGGSMLGGIAGSLVGGWVGQKAGEFLQNKFLGGGSTTASSSSSGGGMLSSITGLFGGGSSGSAPAQPPPQQGQPAPTYSTSGGQPVYNAPGVQITYPQGYQGAPPVPSTTSLTEAKELMTGRYQSFLAASSNPQMQAQMYQNYVQSKNQYEQLLANQRAQAGQ